MTQNGDEMARLESKLDTLIRLFALTVIADKTSLKDSAVHLQKAGLGPKEIAALCDSTPNAVSVALSKAKANTKV